MLLYACWRVVSAFLPGDTGAKAMAHRIGYIVSAVMYTTFAITAIALARRTPTSADGNKKVTDISASIMTHSAGRLLIGLVGLIVIAAGLYRISKGLTMDVNDELDMSGMSRARVSPGPSASALSVRSGEASDSAWSASSCSGQR